MDVAVLNFKSMYVAICGTRFVHVEFSLFNFHCPYVYVAFYQNSLSFVEFSRPLCRLFKGHVGCRNLPLEGPCNASRIHFEIEV